jgi:hypothetical protein
MSCIHITIYFIHVQYHAFFAGEIFSTQKKLGTYDVEATAAHQSPRLGQESPSLDVAPSLKSADHASFFTRTTRTKRGEQVFWSSQR